MNGNECTQISPGDYMNTLNTSHWSERTRFGLNATADAAGTERCGHLGLKTWTLGKMNSG